MPHWHLTHSALRAMAPRSWIATRQAANPTTPLAISAPKPRFVGAVGVKPRAATAAGGSGWTPVAWGQPPGSWCFPRRLSCILVIGPRAGCCPRSDRIDPYILNSGTANLGEDGAYPSGCTFGLCDSAFRLRRTADGPCGGLLLRWPAIGRLGEFGIWLCAGLSRAGLLRGRWIDRRWRLLDWRQRSGSLPVLPAPGRGP